MIGRVRTAMGGYLGQRMVSLLMYYAVILCYCRDPKIIKCIEIRMSPKLTYLSKVLLTHFIACRCGYKRDAGAMRPGDWICPGCRGLVFASKDRTYTKDSVETITAY